MRESVRPVEPGKGRFMRRHAQVSLPTYSRYSFVGERSRIHSPSVEDSGLETASADRYVCAPPVDGTAQSCLTSTY